MQLPCGQRDRTQSTCCYASKSAFQLASGVGKPVVLLRSRPLPRTDRAAVPHVPPRPASLRGGCFVGTVAAAGQGDGLGAADPQLRPAAAVAGPGKARADRAAAPAQHRVRDGGSHPSLLACKLLPRPSVPGPAKLVCAGPELTCVEGQLLPMGGAAAAAAAAASY